MKRSLLGITLAIFVGVGTVAPRARAFTPITVPSTDDLYGDRNHGSGPMGPPFNVRGSMRLGKLVFSFQQRGGPDKVDYFQFRWSRPGKSAVQTKIKRENAHGEFYIPEIPIPNTVYTFMAQEGSGGLFPRWTRWTVSKFRTPTVLGTPKITSAKMVKGRLVFSFRGVGSDGDDWAIYWKRPGKNDGFTREYMKGRPRQFAIPEKLHSNTRYTFQVQAIGWDAFGRKKFTAPAIQSFHIPALTTPKIIGLRRVNNRLVFSFSGVAGAAGKSFNIYWSRAGKPEVRTTIPYDAKVAWTNTEAPRIGVLYTFRVRAVGQDGKATGWAVATFREPRKLTDKAVIGVGTKRSP